MEYKNKHYNKRAIENTGQELENSQEDGGKERLLKEGFDFDRHTDFRASKVKQYQYTFCFDYGYRPIEKKDAYKVVKAFEYKED